MVKFALSFCLLAAPSLLSYAQFVYPETRKVSHTDEYFGIKVEDPYRWLEDDNAADTRQWVAAENQVTSTFLSAIPFRNQMKQRLEELYNYPRFSEPFRNGDYFYYYKNSGLQNQDVLYRQKGLEGSPQVVIDPNTFSADGTTKLADFVLSKDGRYAAWGISRGGSDWNTFYVKDMITLKDLPDSVEWVKASDISWQKNGFYYSRYPTPEKGQELSAKNENHQVWYHVAGTSSSSDRLIYEDTVNLQRFNDAYVSENERYLFLLITDRGKGFEGNALFYQDSESSDKTFKPIVGEVGKYLYHIIGVTPSNQFIIETNDHAPNGKLVVVDPAKPGMTHWKTIISEKPEPLENSGMAGGKLFLRYLKDVTSRIYVHDLSGKRLNEVVLPGLGAAEGFKGRMEDKFVFYSFSSFNFPPQVYKYDMASGKSTVFHKSTVSFDPEDFVTKQEFYTSKDGTRVPMFIVHKKGLVLNSNNPTLLYGYGGFNIILTPWFGTSLLPFLEQGGIFALANIRGGGEYGEKWHEAGMLLKKQNVFDDFIAAEEYLIQKKYTSPSKLAIRGGSNGGLLVGAVINQRPDLCKVAIAEVGVMDMLRFHTFTIGWNWKSEYGSSENEKDFKNLYAYSPLHNIKEGLNYPATLILTADHDDRVVPAHSYKYAATLQEKYKGKNPVMIRIDTNSGHGASNMKKNIELAADIYSFVLYNTGSEYSGGKK